MGDCGIVPLAAVVFPEPELAADSWCALLTVASNLCHCPSSGTHEQWSNGTAALMPSVGLDWKTSTWGWTLLAPASTEVLATALWKEIEGPGRWMHWCKRKWIKKEIHPGKFTWNLKITCYMISSSKPQFVGSCQFSREYMHTKNIWLWLNKNYSCPKKPTQFRTILTIKKLYFEGPIFFES